MTHTLMNEDFSGLRVGGIKEHIDGPYREMHAQPNHEKDNMDEWQNKAGGHWSLASPNFECVKSDNELRIRSIPTACVYDNVHIAKGDFDWQDISMSCKITMLEKDAEGWGGAVGLLFRYLDSTRHYAAVIDKDGMAKIMRRVVNQWDVLAFAPADVSIGETFEISLTAIGANIKATIAGVELSATDSEYKNGIIGLMGAQPAEFSPFKVCCTDEEETAYAERKTKNKAHIKSKREKCGQPKLWKTIKTEGFGAARRIYLGDLTNEGNTDFVLTRLCPEKGLAGVTAMSFAGEVLWQRGTLPTPPIPETSGHAPVQVHDIDGDGKNEVILAMDGMIYALDGATGEEKYSKPLPASSKIPDIYKENIPHWGGRYGDDKETFNARAITFADLTGKGARRDLILSDNYHQTVALDSEFNELWRIVNVHGHYPIPYRPRNEKRDHILNGYRHVDADGKTVGRVVLTDHQDAIYAGPLDENATGPDEILMAGGEDGLVHLTQDYDIHQRVMGHVQRLSIGKFREDVSGLCVSTILFHGNRGVVSMFDSTLKRLWTRDYPVVGSTLQPVLFDDSGVERMLYSGIRKSSGHEGGLIDGYGDLVAELPDDGGAGLCAFAHDFDGDGLDEIMLWDHDQINIYHSDAEVDNAKLLQRERPPLYNMSNFQSYWSRAKTGIIR